MYVCSTPLTPWMSLFTWDRCVANPTSGSTLPCWCFFLAMAEEELSRVKVVSDLSKKGKVFRICSHYFSGFLRSTRDRAARRRGLTQVLLPETQGAIGLATRRDWAMVRGPRFPAHSCRKDLRENKQTNNFGLEKNGQMLHIATESLFP